ncbi:Cyclin family protein [Arabidopsis thaliana]|uniref:Cyclin family protein n=1 Tax=Arabidopsis thaliana TaxID=3702 RepID=A0A1P8AUC8_ARATH|nr:Cyclin family protein [Arabidopsis thaliana]ANM60248.1 Cyclin family protein [Arabidopsis thaliana]|eukprot:NP_001322547.1 Cyclin family protein [Arabidopsis thaliana]
MKEIAMRNSKRKPEPTPFAGKKLRSTRLRRKRAQISPVLVQSPLWSKQIGVSAASVDSCSDLLADDNVSCGSSRVEKSSNPKKTLIEEVSDSLDDESSEQRSEIYSQYSDFDYSDYTPSIFFDSGSEFSEKSSSDSPISHSRSLYLQFKEQFCRSTIPNDFGSSCEEEIHSELLRFDDEEVEESYLRLRERERSHAYMRDCAKAYCSRMDNTGLIPRLRSIMVQWIVKQCSDMGLQQETLFLGVGLLDRFLSKGSFKSERTLILVGIASLTLATRIEENQPYNSIRKRNFTIQNLRYSRHEVVAMEWLVQEVLNFKCFTPTIFNFLFYLKAARANPEVERKAKSLAVTSLSDQTQLCFWPSTVAAALVVLACIEHNKISAYQRVIKVHVRTTDNELPECVKSLDWLLGQ